MPACLFIIIAKTKLLCGFYGYPRAKQPFSGHEPDNFILVYLRKALAKYDLARKTFKVLLPCGIRAEKLALTGNLCLTSKCYFLTKVSTFSSF